VALAAACASAQNGRHAADACREVRGPLTAADSAAQLAGDFSLTLRATSGPDSGRTAVGQLRLVPQDRALIPADGATQPLRGTAAIALETVGATRMGDLAAADPADPGVGVYESRAPGTGVPTVVLRLGSGSNGRGPSPIDAGHLTLFVAGITSGGFAGSWSSSAGSTFPPHRAGGYFCAVRAPD